MKALQQQDSFLETLRAELKKPRTLRKRVHGVLKAVADHFGGTASTLYLLENTTVLEVFSFYDPHAKDTRRTRFRVGEGIVGSMIVTGEPVCTSNLTTHPNFVYRLGVVDYVHLAMMAVPVRLEGGVVGVLSVQNPPAKPFTTDQLESLCVIADLLGALPEIQSLTAYPLPQDDRTVEEVMQGISLSTGIVFGNAVIHHSRSWRETASSQSTKAEQERLKKAIREMMEEIDGLIQTFSGKEESEDILKSYRMIASDRGWVKNIQSFVQQGLTAEAAVQKVRRHTREKFAELGDQYIKARLSDLEDLANRILRHLSGEGVDEIPESSILVASHMGPAELLDYDRRFVKGLILEEGAHSEHVAIVARALGIPVVGRIPSATVRLQKGDLLTLDGETGEVVRNPSYDRLQGVRERISSRKRWELLNDEVRTLPNVTQDGVAFDLKINVGLLIELEHLEKTGAEGVGLYRTEIPFMMRSSFPSTDVQTELYRDVLERAKNKPVYFRTLDIGGDKVVPYMWQIQDENPALGWRAIRLGLDRPALLRHQVRAMLRAHGKRDMHILFPMVTILDEFTRARDIVEEERVRASRLGYESPSHVHYGIMLEVPSLVAQLPAVLRHVDFVAVGSNDLFQYTFACDRSNPHVATRYDSLHPAFLRILKVIQVECAMAGKPLHLCGVMGGKPLSALALLGLGYRAFSVDASALASVKKAFTQTNQQELASYVEEHLLTSEVSLKEQFRDFCTERGWI